MRYVAIVEEVVIHRLDFEAGDDNEAEVMAFEGFRDGWLADSEPYRDAITILSIDTKDEHDGVVKDDTQLLATFFS